MDYSSIRDNHSNGTVGDFLKQAISSNSNVSIVSAYFTIYAYHHLKSNLDAINHLRFLFGEPTFIRSMDPDKINTRDFKIEDDRLVIPIENRLTQKSIAKECSEWIKNKSEIRSMVKPNFLHGKMYHIQQESKIEKAIVGSSNFTVNGLGLGGSKNIELNIVIDSDRDRQELKQWFDAIWNDQTGLVEDVKDEVLKDLEQLYIENEPEFIYFKTLYHIFESYLDEQKKGGLLNDRTGFFDSEIWDMLYDFQKDGVKGAINKILKHNGCIIADSVGLGKTYEALAVIKYFELLNSRVLVLCPKKLTGNWTIYQASQNHVLNPFKKDRFNYTVLYHTDMGRESGRSGANAIDLENFNWGAYDLVVIDESHHFRGNPVEKVKNDGNIKMNRARWLMEKVIKSGAKTKVLMLSATPVNNSLRDLRNQIAFITEGEDDALFDCCKIKDIGLTLKNAQTHFTTWSDPKKNPQRNMKQLLERLDSAFFKLLDGLTIARSRKHIKNFYNIESIGKFPERKKPHSVYPEIDIDNRFPSYDRLNKQILEYKLSVFNPSAYVKPEKQQKYEEIARNGVLAFKQSDREGFLIGMMKINYLKRLESSIESFEISMDRTIQKIEKLESKINEFLKTKATSQEESLESLEPDENELEENADNSEQWQVGKKLKFDMADLELEDWLKDLKKDKESLVDLYNNACFVTPERDAKLVELKKLIASKAKSPFNGENKKVIVFTAFADTAQYLYSNIKDWCRTELKLHCALVCGSYTQTSMGKTDYDNILLNFSPLSKNRNKMTSVSQSEEIDILIATDCISEGQNLQDCDYLINYDIHWNPVRIIQRFGRIDRLGSSNKTIQLVNFWPTSDLDNYINLKERVEARMALVDVTATGEDNILNTEQIEELIRDDLKYRNKQLKKLKEEVLDLEDMDESVSLTDFTLDNFRIELMNFLESNRKRLKEAPFGLYAVVPLPSGEHEKEIIKPGVVFCLKQKDDSHGNEEVNPLNPYFLVYIRNDGTVRFNYTHAMQILEIYRLMCQGKKAPYEKLCELFNDETQNGEQMDGYTGLLKKAVDEIIRIFKKRSNRHLTSDRGAVLIPTTKQLHKMENFELVTWLIVR
ncbi:ATP-dependent helicase [Candidatus Desantisbacteria bacterium CG2_30_40_21]|uniref:ATP-dependent helicase n=3 Tax=unclassified Candidatus Desantisiibacteriota TaxID=3106372 RepID=A0A2M8ARX6_9BACT|nr:MAG: ATP-dependent helicase [Candidatus Desantisbacteria bacterium CG2_30_40_21]PIP42537.1 MAG: ATP-dependent helicase [Candidatus Desantisbacteria bacterium CG23_combo_of_CG06-09_8_20_14_all_40_23]PJB28653.1 MAG: ATP-dependent helicase [Candidatus Desantisbacteria bacterium CG_4_9_14_3_um_filter_40_11]